MGLSRALATKWSIKHLGISGVPGGHTARKLYGTGPLTAPGG